jgi:hypothetical protein
MSKSLSLKEMTLHQKLAAMEALWEDLARSPESIESPAWHEEVLDERRQRISDGKARFENWETAKVEIHNKVS